MAASPVEVEEVDHVAVEQAVDDVAYCAAEDERERPGEDALLAVAAQHDDDEHRCHGAQRDEEPALPARGAGQEAESRAAVVHAHDVEEVGDVARVAELEAAEDEPLGGLV